MSRLPAFLGLIVLASGLVGCGRDAGPPPLDEPLAQPSEKQEEVARATDTEEFHAGEASTPEASGAGSATATPAEFSVPEFEAILGAGEERSRAFIGFVRDHLNETVRLSLQFASGAPYDYRGGEDFALWYPNSGSESVEAGVFFSCEGSFDRRTGYAEQGTIEGLWRVEKMQRLGGDPHYTLQCVRE